MAQSNCLEILLAHDPWATGKLLEACAGLSDEQLDQRFEIGPGSVRETLTHMMAVIATWTDTLAGRELRPRMDLDGQKRTVEELGRLFAEAYRELAAEAGRGPLDDVMPRRMLSGQMMQYTRGAILAHVATHGVHHRAQALNMLRRLGVKPLPASSVAEWTWGS